MSTPHPTLDAPHEAAPAEHHGSWAPFLVAMSAGFLFVGVLALEHGFARVALPIGLLLFGAGLAWWIREDIDRFRHAVGHAAALHGRPGPWLGMVLFIGTEVLIFASIFAVWFVGAGHGFDARGYWRPLELDLPITATAINTAVLVSSGATLHWGYLGLKKGNRNRYLTGLVLTIVLGAAFLVQQVREYLSLIDEGLTVEGFGGQADAYGSAFFMLTGTHGLHVFGGLVFLLVVLVRSLLATQTKEHHVALETAAIYWHFVDVVWLFLFAVVYLEWL